MWVQHHHLGHSSTSASQAATHAASLLVTVAPGSSATASTTINFSADPQVLLDALGAGLRVAVPIYNPLPQASTRPVSLCVPTAGPPR